MLGLEGQKALSSEYTRADLGTSKHCWALTYFQKVSIVDLLWHVCSEVHTCAVWFMHITSQGWMEKVQEEAGNSSNFAAGIPMRQRLLFHVNDPDART